MKNTMPKIQSTTNGLYINLPREYMQLLNWKKSDTLTIYPSTEEKQALIIKKILDANDTPKKELSEKQKAHATQMKKALTKPQEPTTTNTYT